MIKSLFRLVASLNPCPCGYYGHPTRRCTCLPNQVLKYMNKISGPLVDRIDILVEIEPVEFDDMANHAPNELTNDICRRRNDLTEEIVILKLTPDCHHVQNRGLRLKIR